MHCGILIDIPYCRYRYVYLILPYRDNDDDDIIDVAAMGGVNLSEESKNILAAVPETSGQLRSCRDDILLSHTPLASKIRKLGVYSKARIMVFGIRILIGLNNIKCMWLGYRIVLTCI